MLTRIYFCISKTPSELFDWQVRYLDTYLFYVYSYAGWPKLTPVSV